MQRHFMTPCRADLAQNAPCVLLHLVAATATS